MSDKRVNRYRSGAKRPHQEVITSHNDDGTLTVVVADMAHGTIQGHTFPEQKPEKAEPVNQGPEKD